MLKKKNYKKLFIFLLVLSWLLTGFPTIWTNPQFPPELTEVKAAQITVGNVNTVESGNISAAMTHTVPAGGTDLLLVGVILETDASDKEVSSIVWASDSGDQTLVPYNAFNPGHAKLRIEVFRYIGASEGTSNNITVTLEGAQKWSAVAMNLENVDSGTPLTGWVTDSATDGAGSVTGLTQDANDLAVCFAGFNKTSSEFIAVSGENEHADFPAQGTWDMWACSEDVDGATTMSWTHGGGSNENSTVGFIVEEAVPSDPTFTQNKYRWYVDNDATNPTDAWSATAGVDLAENTEITITPYDYDPPDTTQELRLRVNFSVATANMAISTEYFKLQFRTGTDSDCSTGSWTDVNTSATWEYATSTVTDGADITASISDTTSGKGQEYVKSRPAQVNHVAVNTTEITEYDFHIIGTTAATAERYLFRVVETDSGGTATTAFTAYTNCAILNTEPGTDNLLRHGDVFSGGVEAGFYWTD